MFGLEHKMLFYVVIYMSGENPLDMLADLLAKGKATVVVKDCHPAEGRGIPAQGPGHQGRHRTLPADDPDLSGGAQQQQHKTRGDTKFTGRRKTLPPSAIVRAWTFKD